MWINNTFEDEEKSSNLVRRLLLLEYEGKGKDPTKVSEIATETLYWSRVSKYLNFACVHRTKATQKDRVETV